MAFRRDSKEAHRWKTWLSINFDSLLGAGVPHSVLEDERAWDYFLGHGYYAPVGAGDAVINVDDMPSVDMERLCDILESHPPYCASGACNRLQFLLRRGCHAE